MNFFKKGGNHQPNFYGNIYKETNNHVTLHGSVMKNSFTNMII